ncbi:autotransporter domain-containing protein [Prosthecobacter sp.]|uniref:autotransporter domain-containing protein n=1 Tax=Prosthecobacter sp. TaxID=1965333 RepID=UPI0037CB083B
MRRISWCMIAAAAFAEFQLSAAVAPIDLGQAVDFRVLAGSGITNTGATTIIGDVGSLPTSTITGFGSVALTGTNHGGDAITLAGKADLLTAFNDGAGRLPTIIYGPIHNFGTETLTAGIYNDPSSFGLTGALTLDGGGDPNAIFIFQAGSTLITAVGSSVTLINGAQAGNIFWVVGSSATLGVNSSLSGTIMAMTSITLNTGATLDGRALALNGAVTMDTNTISLTPLAPGVPGAPTHWLGAASGLWTTVGNWASNQAGTPATAIPSLADNITFSATGAANQSTTLGANFTINNLTINDTAAVTIAGANTLTLAGDPGLTVNSGAGLLTISSGLAFTGATPTVTVNNTAGAVFSGAVTSAGSLTKAGPGTLVISGATTVTGPANINAGTLNIATGGTFTATGTTTLASGSTVSVTGALVSPTVNVLLGGNLTGAGTITGNVNNFGTVNPGAPVGTLTINGSYTQGGTGLLPTELVVTPHNNDKLLISGAANLGGTLLITTAGGLRPNLGDSFNIINAGSVASTFATVINPFEGPGTLVKLVVVYTPTDVFVNAVQNTFANALSLIPLTPNQTATAGALDSALTDVRQTAVLGYLNGLNINAVPHELDRIAPEELTAIYSIAFAQLDTEILSVQQRLSSIRNASWSNASPETSGKEAILGGVLSPSSTPQYARHGFFVNATGQYASLGNTTNANGFDVQSVGTTLGADVRLNENWVVGLTLGYARSNSDLTEGGSLSADGMRAAVYAMYLRGSFYTEFLVGGSFNSYETRRSALGGTAEGSTNSQSFDAYVGTGYNIQVNDHWSITPMASLRYTDVNIDSFQETGSLQPLAFPSQNQNSLRSRIGLQAAYTTHVGETRITPYLGLHWQHEFLDNELAMVSRFANGAGNPFTVHGPRIGRDSAVATAGINVGWSRYSVYAAYQAEMFRTNYDSHTMIVGFRVLW